MDQRQPSKQPKSLYDASIKEVAMKNFLAGFMHGLGGLLVTLFSWFLLYLLITRLVLPQLVSVLGQAEGLMKSVEQLNSVIQPRGDNPSGTQDQVELQQNLLRQLQQFQQPRQTL